MLSQGQKDVVLHGFSHGRVIFFSIAETHTDSWSESETAFLVPEPFPLFSAQHLSLRVSWYTWVTWTSQSHPLRLCWSKSTIPTTFTLPVYPLGKVIQLTKSSKLFSPVLLEGSCPAHALSHRAELCDTGTASGLPPKQAQLGWDLEYKNLDK